MKIVLHLLYIYTIKRFIFYSVCLSCKRFNVEVLLKKMY